MSSFTAMIFVLRPSFRRWFHSMRPKLVKGLFGMELHWSGEQVLLEGVYAPLGVVLILHFIIYLLYKFIDIYLIHIDIYNLYDIIYSYN